MEWIRLCGRKGGGGGRFQARVAFTMMPSVARCGFVLPAMCSWLRRMCRSRAIQEPDPLTQSKDPLRTDLSESRSL